MRISQAQPSCVFSQPPPSPEGWETESDEEDGLADQEPLNINWSAVSSGGGCFFYRFSLVQDCPEDVSSGNLLSAR